MTGVAIVLLAGLVVAATAYAHLVLRERMRGLRLMLLAPVPAALFVGGIMASYLAIIAGIGLGNVPALLFWVAPPMLAAWLVGLVFCAAMAAARAVRARRGGRP